MNETENFDAIIVGGGAAGISAALWCAELGLHALLLEAQAELGGQLLRIYNPVKNHLGAEARDGRELRDRFVRQSQNWNFAVRCDAEIAEIDAQAKRIILQSGERLAARALIIATGVRRRKLGVAGETRFKGRGILASGAGERDSVAGKRVAIVGGGDAAVENALILAEKAAAVALVHRGKKFRARAEFLEKIRVNPKIKIYTETVVAKITGGERLESVGLKNEATGESLLLPTDALLIRIGVEPNTELVRGQVETDEAGYLKIDSRCETSAANVFAVGDAANPLAPTVSSAVGMGATAAKVIYERLRAG